MPIGGLNIIYYRIKDMILILYKNKFTIVVLF